MIQLDHVHKSLGARDLFSDVTWRIDPGDRIALVGPNGTGKTTLLRILVGQYQPDGGSVHRQRDLTIGYLTQEQRFESDLSVSEAMWEAIPALHEARKQLIDHASGDWQQLGAYQQTYEALGGYAFEGKAARVLAGLGFQESDRERPVNEFSGGWRVRMALARLLLSEPDVLVLDEPTNHLDVAAIEWLEDYLQSFSGALVLVSHDRRFLDRTVNRVAALEEATLVTYTGNYTRYREEKAARIEALIDAKERQDRELARQQATIDRFRAKATKAAGAKSREKMLAKIERIEVPTEESHVKLTFPAPPPLDQQALRLVKLSHGFTHPLFECRELVVERGWRALFVGPNGLGKSTLLKLVAGLAKPNQGSLILGRGAKVGYFAQHQADDLPLSSTALDEALSVAPHLPQAQVRAILARLLLKGDQVHQTIESLSGGERARLAIAKLLLQSFNILVLDEPTNHLDIPSKEALAAALSDYPGTVLAASHDRAFVDDVATHLMVVDGGELKLIHGTYTHLKAAQPAPSPVPKPQGKPRRLGQVEKEIMVLEEKISALELKMAEDPAAAYKFTDEHRALQDKLTAANAEWEEMVERLS